MTRSLRATAPAKLSNRSSMLDHRIGPIEYRQTSILTAYTNNARKHPQRQMTQLMASISEFGFVLPALIDINNIIIAGHARVEAARNLGMTEVPVIIADQLSPQQVQAYRLADNRLAELSEWDRSLLKIELASIVEADEVHIESTGWATAEIDVLLSEADVGAGNADIADEQEEVPAVATSRADDLWLCGPHRVLCGSCLEAGNWDRLMDGRKAVMSFVDPPYNVSVTKHVGGLGKVKHAEFAMASGEMSREEFRAFLANSLGALVAALIDGAIIDIAMDWRHIEDLLFVLRQLGLTVINICVWNKMNGGMGSLYRSKYELVVIAKKGKTPHINNVELGRHGRYRTNVWDYAGVNSFGSNRMEDLKDHPTVKPIALVADAIRDVTKAGDIVIDGFLGSGTTILAAERAKRVGYGIELDPCYVDVVLRRWSKMTGGTATLASTGQTFEEVAAERLVELDPD